MEQSYYNDAFTVVHLPCPKTYSTRASLLCHALRDSRNRLGDCCLQSSCCSCAFLRCNILQAAALAKLKLPWWPCTVRSFRCLEYCGVVHIHQSIASSQQLVQSCWWRGYADRRWVSSLLWDLDTERRPGEWGQDHRMRQNFVRV
jgi:hypothetical protein